MTTFLSVVALTIASRRTHFLLQMSCQKKGLNSCGACRDKCSDFVGWLGIRAIKSRAAPDESVTDSQHWQYFVATAVASSLSRGRTYEISKESQSGHPFAMI